MQTSLHDGEVLVGQGKIHDQVGLELVEECYELLHAVGVNLGGFDVIATNGLDNGVAFRLGATCYHDFAKHISVLCHLVGSYGCDATGADNQYFSHLYYVDIM